MKKEKPLVVVVLSTVFAAGIVCIFFVSLNFTVISQWSCCPGFLIAMITAVVLSYVDKALDVCNCLGNAWNVGVARCIVKLIIVACIGSTIQKGFECDGDGWLVYLKVLSVILIVSHSFHFLYLAAQVLVYKKYEKLPPDAAKVSVTVWKREQQAQFDPEAFNGTDPEPYNGTIQRGPDERFNGPTIRTGLAAEGA